MDARNYEIKNKNLHLVKADKDNFWPLMDLTRCYCIKLSQSI